MGSLSGSDRKGGRIATREEVSKGLDCFRAGRLVARRLSPHCPAGSGVVGPATDHRAERCQMLMR